MTYLGHHVTLTWGQILTLTFQSHGYTCFDASWRGKHDGVKMIALSFQTREVIIEKLFRLKMPFLTFRDLWRLNR